MLLPETSAVTVTVADATPMSVVGIAMPVPEAATSPLGRDRHFQHDQESQ
jgi:hypothetical protein